MLRTFAIVTFALLLFSLGAACALAQQQVDPETQRQVSSAIIQQLEPYALYSNGRFYTNFQISGQAAGAPQGGFAPALTPQGAPIVGSGVMEITPQYPWSFSLFPDSSGSLRGVVSVRLAQYRVYDPQGGWSYPKNLMIHFWEWNVKVDADGPQVAVKMDGTNFPTDNGARELVASVYNVAPSGVSVAQIDPSLLGQILSVGSRPMGGAQTRACRPCERQAADGTCHQWRACF